MLYINLQLTRHKCKMLHIILSLSPVVTGVVRIIAGV